jgi:hypothetical protein
VYTDWWWYFSAPTVNLNCYATLLGKSAYSYQFCFIIFYHSHHSPNSVTAP